MSKSYDKIRYIIEQFDSQAHVNQPSGRHTTPNWESDVKELSAQYSQEKLFEIKPGRFHNRFPSFQTNILYGIEQVTFKKWALNKIIKFSQMIIYKHPFNEIS